MNFTARLSFSLPKPETISPNQDPLVSLIMNRSQLLTKALRGVSGLRSKTSETTPSSYTEKT